MKKVLAGGCFNKLHPGHVYFLKKAKAMGYLIVVLTNDKNNKKPYAVKAKKRKNNLEKLKIADRILIGHATDFSKTVEKVRPDIIVLGYDQKLGMKIDKIRVKRIKKFGRYSSRTI